MKKRKRKKKTDKQLDMALKLQNFIDAGKKCQCDKCGLDFKINTERTKDGSWYVTMWCEECKTCVFANLNSVSYECHDNYPKGVKWNDFYWFH